MIAGLLVRPDRSQRLQGVSRTILLPAVFLLTFGTFLAVLVTYFGVNLLLGGMHSYA